VFSFCHIVKLLLIFDRDIFVVAGSCKRLWALLSFWLDVCVDFMLENKYVAYIQYYRIKWVDMGAATATLKTTDWKTENRDLAGWKTRELEIKYLFITRPSLGGRVKCCTSTIR